MDQPIRAMAGRFAVSLSTGSTCQEHGAATRRRASTPGVKMALGGQQPRSRTELSASLSEEEKEKHHRSATILSQQGHFPAQSETAQHQLPKQARCPEMPVLYLSIDTYTYVQ